VTFFGVEPFAPCVHCGKADGVVHHVRDNRHLNRPSIPLHEACVAGWLASQEGNGKGDGGDAICAHCCLPGGNEVFFSDRPMVRLHRECEEPYQRISDEGQSGPEGAPADDNDDTWQGR
jgi:hypothetical protein